MLSSLLLVYLYFPGPKFAAVPISVTGENPRIIAALGFLRNGDLVVYDPYARKRVFIIHDNKPIPVFIDSGPIAPSISNDGEIEQIKKNTKGNMAVFRYRDNAWVQVTPASAHYSDSYVQNENGLGVATVKAPNGPWWAVMTQNGHSTDMRPVLKTTYSKAFAVTPDGAILLAAGPSPADYTYFWWRDGKRISSVKMPSMSWAGDFHITPRREFILKDDRWIDRHFVFGNAVLVDGEKSSEVSGPAAPLVKAILGHGRWFGGEEPSTNIGRAVLIAEDKPYYVDDLVVNMASLKINNGFSGFFTTIQAIAPDGRLIATGHVVDRTRNETYDQIFLLTPVTSSR